MVMSNFSVSNVPKIDGLKIITPFFLEDQRGYFLKGYERDVFSGFGIEGEIQEDFESYSVKGVLRGMHFQLKYPQTKIVRVLAGEIYDIAIDLRWESITYGKWHSEILSDKNHNAFYIPKGFAHGFLVLSDYALVQYKCIGRYFKEYDTGIIWNDKKLSIDWPVDAVKNDLIITEKDQNGMTFEEYTKLHAVMENEKENADSKTDLPMG